MELNILYEDNHIIVCVKPRDVLSQAGPMNKPDMVNLLKDYIKDKYNKPGNVYLGLVHRLDINVSGVMVFAKTSKAAARLSEQIKKHEFKKSYLAIVEGGFDERKGVYEENLIKDEDKRQAFVSKDGKLAKLNYDILELNQNLSLVKVNLITGRFHQIRCQFSYHDHPLLGDTKYGSNTKNKDFFLGLTAYKLEFNHPTKKEPMVFMYKPLDKRFTSFKSLDEINWRSK